MPATPNIVDVGTEDFRAQVIERSRTATVMVDFWATWCGPCRTLSPVLEKLASENPNLVLAKVDIDRHAELAELFRIQSVPAVILFAGGRPVDGFVGAQTEAQVRRFLAPHLKGTPPSAVEQARALSEAGKRAEAIELLRKHLREQASDSPARIALARLLLDDNRADEARKVFDKVGEAERDNDEARAVLAQLGLLESAGDVSALKETVEKDPRNPAKRLELGRALIASRRYPEGLEQLFEAARIDVHHDGDAPRKALLEAFAALGPTDPLTLEYQRRLSILLAS